jgi:tetratricopeptide (TPR) repeat protein
MITCFLLFFYSLFSTQTVSSSDPDRKFSRGIQLLQEKNYAEAIASFQDLLKEGYQAPEVYHNLGVAYAQNGQLGKAVLYHYRALRLAPGDEEIIKNLTVCLKKANLPETEINELSKQPLAAYLSVQASVDQWALVLLIGSCSLLLLFIGNTYVHAVIPATVSKKVSGVLLVVCLIALLSIAYQTYLLFPEKEAFITAGPVTAKKAPNEKAKDSLILSEGTKVEVLDIFKGWAKVKLTNGITGWVKTEAIEGVASK